MLHAPDFLGYESAIELAQDAPAAVERGLALKKTGNQVMTLVGGREVHPINVRVGGFYRAPTRRELGTLVEPLERAREAALETVRWTAGFEFPEREVECELVAISHPGAYAIERGRVVSDRGLDIAVSEYDQHFVEEHVERSNALQSHRADGSTYLCGPLARFAVNREQLTPLACEAARDAGLDGPCRNPFQSIVVRSVELLYACDEALRLIAAYEEPDAPAVPVEPRQASGSASPKRRAGCCYHRYELDDEGTILDAKIVPPTSQNQLAIEDDLRAVVGRYATLGDDELRILSEQTIRNYDPCISCATHFLDARGRAAVSRASSSASATPTAVTTASGSRWPSGCADASRAASRFSTASRSRPGCSTRGKAPTSRSSSMPSPPARPRPGRCTASTRARAAFPPASFRSSTHAFGVGDAVELARALGRLPRRVVVYGVEGADFAAGAR